MGQYPVSVPPLMTPEQDQKSNCVRKALHTQLQSDPRVKGNFISFSEINIWQKNEPVGNYLQNKKVIIGVV